MGVSPLSDEGAPTNEQNSKVLTGNIKLEQLFSDSA